MFPYICEFLNLIKRSFCFLQLSDFLLSIKWICDREQHRLLIKDINFNSFVLRKFWNCISEVSRGEYTFWEDYTPGASVNAHYYNYNILL